MSKPTDFKQAMEAEDRKSWLEGEYTRLKKLADPMVKQREQMVDALKTLEILAEGIARQAYGVLLALGKGEAEAAKEIASWRKREG